MNAEYINQALKVYIISLDYSSPLVERMTSKLERMGIKYDFRDAVDGRNGKPKLKNGESINQRKAILKRRAILTDTEIACYLSHYRSVKDAYIRGVERMLVLEDDVDFEDRFYEILKKIVKLPRDFELIRLMGLKPKPRKLVSEILPGVMITRPLKGILGTQGYVLNREGMRKIIKRGAEISEPVDKFYDRYWRTKIKSYCIEPHVMWEVARPTTVKKSREKDADLSMNEYVIGKLYRGLDISISMLHRLFFFYSFYPYKKNKNVEIKSQKFS